VRLLVAMLLAMLLAGCAPRTSVRVDPAPTRPSSTEQAAPARAAAEYVVQRGDTLYGIAFRHGMDYRQLAAHNRISPPYTIYPGQRLRLASAGQTTAAAPPRRGVVAPIAQTPPPAHPPAATATPARPAPVTTAPAAGQATPAPAAAASAASGPIRWRWPAEGQLAGRFVANDPTRQGLAIAGSAGQPVSAAADGVVVYSGSGLIGYGELIIIKHSDEWLSAYGHNRKRLVAEGESVRAGQQIAEMGRSGASRDMLHFEIRRNGRPVDPQGVLPQKP
jgi:lipoprotein NlpD